MKSAVLPSMLSIAVMSLFVACGDQQAAGGPGPGAAPPPIPVKLAKIELQPVARTSEFIAAVRSLQSTTIQPEVDGILTRIFVRSGDRVRPGTPLVQIDSERQEATVRSVEANRAGTAADVQYWRGHVKRLESLLDAGAISRQEFEVAQTSLRTAEARLSALDAQLREGQVALRYYKVTAPQSGVVGDIPVRAGDRVTTSTVITTIDTNEGLEAHIAVPIERAPELRLGLPVELLASDGTVAAENEITFVAPRVDEHTQSVLAKSLLRDVPENLRAQQFVRTRIVWETRPGLRIPVVAVTRQGGQYFCYVAEPQDGSLVARRRSLQVGEILGDEYVVLEGLSPGETVVVSGLQKIRDGAPVQAE